MEFFENQKKKGVPLRGTPLSLLIEL